MPRAVRSNPCGHVSCHAWPIQVCLEPGKMVALCTCQQRCVCHVHLQFVNSAACSRGQMLVQAWVQVWVRVVQSLYTPDHLSVCAH